MNNKDFLKEKQKAEAIAKTIEMSNKVKDLILERMAGMYFRVEQLRTLPGYEFVTVAEIVDKMPEASAEQKAVKYSWTVDYMLEAFHDIMIKDGEEVRAEVLGNLSEIKAPTGPSIVKI
jgi:ubiquinone biosynthesis protein Coq4